MANRKKSEDDKARMVNISMKTSLARRFTQRAEEMNIPNSQIVCRLLEGWLSGAITLPPIEGSVPASAPYPGVDIMAEIEALRSQMQALSEARQTSAAAHDARIIQKTISDAPDPSPLNIIPRSKPGRVAGRTDVSAEEKRELAFSIEAHRQKEGLSIKAYRDKYGKDISHLKDWLAGKGNMSRVNYEALKAIISTSGGGDE